MNFAAPRSPKLKRATVCLMAGATIVGSTLWGSVPFVNAATCGALNVSGSSWAGGYGVDSRSNGVDEGTGTSCGSFVANLNANPPQYGEGWQCVELAQRMFNTRGWYSGTFTGVNYASQIYTTASTNGWTTMAQGSITLSSIHPGDMLVTNEGTYGHVMLVDSISGNTISVVDQNAGDGGRDTVSFSNGSLSDGSYTFSGVVHSPNDTLSGGGTTYSSTPAALQFGTEMDVFKRGGDNAIWKDTWQSGGSSWSGWNSLGGTIASDPVAVAYGSEMDVFAIASNGQVVKDTWNGTSWSGWNSLGGTMTGTPSAVVYGSEMDVYARNPNDNKIWIDTWNGSSWGGWSNLGAATFSGNPKAMVYGSEMDVWARGSDNALWKDTWNGSSWGGFSSMGGTISGDPVAIQYYSEMDVYANTPGGQMFKQTWNGTSWSGWVGMGGTTFVGSPGALQYGSEMDVYIRASDGHIYKDTWNTVTWSGWNSLGGNESGNPTSIQYGSEMDVYVTNSNNNIDKDTWNGSTWGGFSALL